VTQDLPMDWFTSHFSTVNKWCMEIGVEPWALLINDVSDHLLNTLNSLSKW
jgi:hypothetical protein